MRLWSHNLAFALAVVACGDAFAQESFPPTPIGGGARLTRKFAGQIVEIEATGTVNAVVVFEEVTLRRVAGQVYRTEGAGDVIIRWWNRDLEVMVALGPEHTNEVFEMLGPPVGRLPLRRERD